MEFWPPADTGAAGRAAAAGGSAPVKTDGNWRKVVLWQSASKHARSYGKQLHLLLAVSASTCRGASNGEAHKPYCNMH